MRNENVNATNNGDSSKEAAEKRLIYIQSFLEEAAMTIEYWRWRVVSERLGEQPASYLFKLTADMDGPFSEDQVLEQLDAIARQARAGFCRGEGFPVFGVLAADQDRMSRSGKETCQ